MRPPSFLIRSLLGIGMTFLYAPILLVVIYSFNKSERVSVWGGWSLKWYASLFSDSQMLTAAGRSLIIAAATASLALVLGTLAAYVLTRRRRFHGRRMLETMTTLPLVMPEVVTGMSLLLLFVSIQQLVTSFERTLVAIIIAHSTFAIAYTTIVVRSRLSQLDEEIEYAARDLGAGDATVFFTITLPLLTPALIAAWLLTFVLSFDDLVIASFVAGPRATTLPMEIFSSIRLGFTPQINALSTLMIALAFIVLALAWWQGRGSLTTDPQT